MAEMKLFQVYMYFFHEYTGWCNIGQIKGKIKKFFVFAFCNLCGLGSNRQC